MEEGVLTTETRHGDAIGTLDAGDEAVRRND